jgi:hypothetical protein
MVAAINVTSYAWRLTMLGMMEDLLRMDAAAQPGFQPMLFRGCESFAPETTVRSRADTNEDIST